MSSKRLLLLPILALLIYLGVYSWNQRTGWLDDLAANTGLEAVGVVLKTLRWGQDTVTDAWDRYLDLVGVREENERLKERLATMETRLILAAEEKAELIRLRTLLTFSPPESWQTLGARVLAGRMGSNAALVTVTIGRGYLTGASPGTPVMTPGGVVGRVYRAGPSTATVLLLTDPGSRVAVISQNGRVQGVLAGNGPFKPLELRFVSHNAVVPGGELLVTSGLDEAFPKGLPVARVLRAAPSELSLFQSVQATPLADLSALEEVLLLARATPVPLGAAEMPVRSPVGEEMGPPVPPTLAVPKPGTARTRPSGSPSAPATGATSGPTSVPGTSPPARPVPATGTATP